MCFVRAAAHMKSCRLLGASLAWRNWMMRSMSTVWLVWLVWMGGCGLKGLWKWVKILQIPGFSRCSYLWRKFLSKWNSPKLRRPQGGRGGWTNCRISLALSSSGCLQNCRFSEISFWNCLPLELESLGVSETGCLVEDSAFPQTLGILDFQLPWGQTEWLYLLRKFWEVQGQRHADQTFSTVFAIFCSLPRFTVLADEPGRKNLTTSTYLSTRRKNVESCMSTVEATQNS